MTSTIVPINLVVLQLCVEFLQAVPPCFEVPMLVEVMGSSLFLEFS